MNQKDSRIRSVPIWVIELLLNVKEDFGPSGLHYAVGNQDIEIVEALIERGADVNVLDIYGRTTLHRAADGEDTEMLDLLLTTGAKVDI